MNVRLETLGFESAVVIVSQVQVFTGAAKIKEMLSKRPERKEATFEISV